MADINYESDSLSESDDCSYLSEEDAREMEDEECSSEYESDSHPETGPYSGEPIADEEWLKEYKKERERIEKHNKELQDRIDGVTAVDLWCSCGNCRVDSLQNPNESQCCHEIEGCMESLSGDLVIQEVEIPPICVTLHPGFNAVCINRWSLRSSSVKYKTTDGFKYRQTGTEDSLLRATAYREFTQLIHGYLGAKRIPLPACVYDKIRKEFPSENYFTGYEDNE